ncbi:MAG TPA: polysaccharide biosynthesis/export family protein [Longimicrobiaceae bacterium]|nr:polysaccharide biosynthesis/export family protein [Longimicrobiaceae bacterium]
MRKSLLLVALAAVLAPMGLSAQQAAPAATEEVVLHPGDAIKINVWRKPELSGEFTVAADGSVADAFYGSVKVADVPFSTAEARIKEYVHRIETTPWVWVEPLFRITVGGEVRQPNVYLMKRESTIAQAVAQAGGATASGRIDHVRLSRGGQVIMVDLADPANRFAHTPIRSGDEIVVGRQRSIFREYIAPSASVVAAIGVVLRLFVK